MLEEPRITLFCDSCGDVEAFDLTSLAGGGWDDRNVKDDAEWYGWEWTDIDHHRCPGCVEDAEQEDEEEFLCPDGCGCDERDCECDE